MSKLRLRKYQERSVQSVLDAFAQGNTAVCLASAVGSGKTLMAAELVRRMKKTVLWVAHTRELVEQAAHALRNQTGKKVGILMPGHTPSQADIQVGTVQTLLWLQLDMYNPELLFLDETHHYEAEVWTKIKKLSHAKKIFGFTAAPERADGRPLGDTFQILIEGAQYQELLAQKVLVPWTIYQPPKNLGHNFAFDPITAYRDVSRTHNMKKAFGYYQRIQLAEEYSKRFRENRIAAATISALTPKAERHESIHALSLNGRERVDVVNNVYTMVEGVDVPKVSIILLARPFQHISGYIQATGRAARAAPGKTHAVLIDLCGSSRHHGPPDQDWNYSLAYGIQRKDNTNDEQEEPLDAKRKFLLPIIDGCGIYLSQDSSFIPEDPPPPKQYLPPLPPRKHAQLHHEFKLRMARRSGQKIANTVAIQNEGLGE